MQEIKSKNNLDKDMIQIILRTISAPEKEYLDGKRDIIKNNLTEILALANDNMAVVRFIDILEEFLPSLHKELGLKDKRLNFFQKTERSLGLMKKINTLFMRHDINFVFIKSLDHYPDAGNDVDILTFSNHKDLINDLLQKEFSAKINQKAPSFSDRMSEKINYLIKDNPALEIHHDRLGQLGDMPEFAKYILEHKVNKKIQYNGETIELPYPEPNSSLMLQILQRIYRHFYIRVSDIENSMNIIKEPSFNLASFLKITGLFGIKPGAYCYLHYLNQLHLSMFQVPVRDDFQKMLNDAVEERERVYFNDIIYKRPYYRVPLKTVPMLIYRKKIIHEIKSGKFANCFRLSILPFLAAYTMTNLKLGRGSKGW